jgi:hypothetical protein
MHDNGRSKGESAPSLPANCSMLFHGFTSEEQAHEFGDPLHECMVEVSRHLDLERLDAVTITFFYAQSLRTLDRGFENAAVFTADENEVALPVMVKRGSVTKMHLVIDARILPPLRDPKHKDYGYIFHLVANQCVLVHDLKYKDLAFLDAMRMQRYETDAEYFFDKMIWPCWDGYSASRQSARYLTAEIFDEGDGRFLDHLGTAQSAVDVLHKQYRADGDTQTFTTEALARSDDLMHSACRFLGNLHGTATPVQERPNVYKVLDGHWFEPIFRDLDKALVELSANYGHWQRADFNVLADITKHLLSVWRIEVAPQDGGLAVFIDRKA